MLARTRTIPSDDAADTVFGTLDHEHGMSGFP